MNNRGINVTAQRRLEFETNGDEMEVENDAFDDEDGDKLISSRHSTIPNDKIPHIGMGFDSEDAAFNFYNKYAKAVGFSIRRDVAHKDSENRILDRIFCCSCQGNRKPDKRDVLVKSRRPHTRKGCRAMMKVNARSTGRYMVDKFIAAHNGHDLASPTKSHMLRSQRRMTIAQKSQVDDIDYSGIAPKAGFELMVKQMGGRENIGFMIEDLKNYLRSRRTIQMKKGDTGGVLEYLQEKQSNDPNFFYAIQVDQDDLITNIFWTDAQMMADFAFFGDVVSFDTTYRKNKDGRPFGLFVGINHHRQTSIFGAALLYDETAETFMWLFDTFTRAMSGKRPQTILTDQDAAMAKALAIKWPDTYHRLCIWHIYQNAATHLGSFFASFKDFSKDFSSCIYDYEEEDEFVDAWHRMLETYGLQTNDWLHRMFNIKEKWSLVYGRNTFCGDMTTTQRSESINGVLKRYVSYKNNMLQFFENFQKLVDDRRYKELKADLWTTQATPELSLEVEILKHARSIYTHEVLQEFQKEFSKGIDSGIELYSSNGEISEYRVTPCRKRRHHRVTYDSSTGEARCSCKKFEFGGILCSHILKVFIIRGIRRIPSIYINKRWTKKAKKGLANGQCFADCDNPHEPTNDNDAKQMIALRYKELCQLHNQLTTRAALTLETYTIAKNGILKLIEEVDANFEERTIEGSHNRSNSTVKESHVSRIVSKQTLPPKAREKESVVEKDYLGASQGTGDASTSPLSVVDDVTIRGLRVKEKKGVKSQKRLMRGIEKTKRKSQPKQPKENIISSSKFQHAPHGNSDSSYTVHNLNNGGDNVSFCTSMESSVVPAFPQLSLSSQISQVGEDGRTSSNFHNSSQEYSSLNYLNLNREGNNISFGTSMECSSVPPFSQLSFSSQLSQVEEGGRSSLNLYCPAQGHSSLMKLLEEQSSRQN